MKLIHSSLGIAGAGLAGEYHAGTLQSNSIRDVTIINLNVSGTPQIMISRNNKG
jgi:hypothetical protein